MFTIAGFLLLLLFCLALIAHCYKKKVNIQQRMHTNHYNTTGVYLNVDNNQNNPDESKFEFLILTRL